MRYIALNDVKVREPIPGYRARFVHSDKVTIAYWEIAAGAPMPEHRHPHEQTVNVVEGWFALTVAGETKELGPGAVVVIAGDVPHSGRAVTDCRIIDVFCPVREEYRQI